MRVRRGRSRGGEHEDGSEKRNLRPGKGCRAWILIGVLAALLVGVGMLVLWEGVWGVGFRRWRVDATSELGPEQEPIFQASVENQDKLPEAEATHGHDAIEQHEERHPIEQLIVAAEKRFALQLATQATDLPSAAQAYRKRRRRHPPPGFDAWFEYAQSHDAVIVESFFDSIYDDLAPFWGEDVYNLQRTVQTFSPKISIRNGTVDSARKKSYKRLAEMVNMMQELLSDEGVTIPDTDIPFNVREEVGMLVPFEAVDTALQFARPMLPPPEDVLSAFSPFNDTLFANASTFDPAWLDGRLRHTLESKFYGPRPFWQLFQPACAPDAPSRKSKFFADIWSKYGRTLPEHSAAAMLPRDADALPDSFRGYVANWTDAQDACRMPWVQGLHGAFVAPEEMSVTTKLFPFWSSSKMTASNEVLVPSAYSWNASAATGEQAAPWDEMRDSLFWRGPATGGKNAEGNWRRFHRHRLVAMLNATHVEIAEGLLHEGNETMVGVGYAGNFRLLPGNPYGLRTQRVAGMAEWVDGWADVAFTDLHCGNGDDGTGGCNYTNEYFGVTDAPGNLTSELASKSKYAMLLDDNGGDDQGEFTKVLESGRLAIKSSVYKQWYDDRVVPWAHFVPVDTTLVDLYGVMEYFLGTSTKGKGEYAHARVELPKHDHHFQIPHADRETTQRREVTVESRSAKDSRGDEVTNDGHDGAARKIAEAGQAWAAKVLRKEDMSIFMYRLLLEYARVVDVRRMQLGWVGDLKDANGRSNASQAGATQHTRASHQFSIPPT